MNSTKKVPYYVGIDIGTTAVKAVAFDIAGNMLAKTLVNNITNHPQPGYSEQNPDQIADNTESALQQLLSEMGDAPECIAFSAAMHGFIAFDKDGIPLTPCFTWADIRANEQAQQLQSDKNSLLHEKTGVPIHPMSPVCKLLWLQQQQAATFKKAHVFAGIKEYIVFKLTGKWMIDTSMASATGLFNIHTLKWDESILGMVHISKEQLPEVFATDTFFTAKDNRYTTTKFLLGGSDGAMAAYAGYPDPAATVSIGTSAAVRLITDAPAIDPASKLFCYHIKDQLYVTGGASNNGAVALQWWKENILSSTQSYDHLLNEAALIAPGSDGVIFLPYLSGERAPLWNAHAKAAFIGLQIHHQQAVLTRAIAEGVILNLYQILLLLDKFKYSDTLKVAGGFAASTFWLQLLADISDRKVVVENHPEASAWGAVKIGLPSSHPLSDAAPQYEKTYYPNKLLTALYKQLAIEQEHYYKLLLH